MKHLLFCLLIGSFVFPAWSQEKEMTLDEFIEKVGRIQPWTLENLESKLDVKFEQTSSTGVVKRYTAYDPPPSAKNLPVQSISIKILEATNETLVLNADIDSDSVCLKLEHLAAMYPKGFFDIRHAHPEGGAAYYDARTWGVAAFYFALNPKKGECVTLISFDEDRQVKDYDEYILKYVRDLK